MAEGESLVCAGCGLLCDDVTVAGEGDAVRVVPECHLGTEWLSTRIGRPATPAATVDGQAADVEAALGRAGELLRGARRPLLYGFAGATVEDARAAVALADRLGALVAADGVDAPWPGAPAVALRGASTATLGEIRDRSQLVVIWREDPETTHPRLLERLGRGHGAPTGSRGERTLVVLDDRNTATAAAADVRLRWPPERDLEALVGLHALQRGLALRDGDLAAPLGALMDHVRGVGHLAIIHGAGLTCGAGGQRRALALHELVRALSDDRHAVTLALDGTTASRAARDVLAWQTGYDGNVDFAAGHPELATATEPLISAEGIDVAVRVESSAGQLPGGVVEIVLGSLPAGTEAAVTVRTAAAGVEAPGTAHRLDGVPLALVGPRAGDAPTAAALLARLLEEVTQ